MRGLKVLISMILAATVLPAAARPTARPNVLVLIADDLRADAIGALGGEAVRTPNLDALAARSRVFSRAYCSYPICRVSRAEMMTGRHAWENGIDGMSGNTFREGVSFWAEAFRDADYATWHVGKWHVPGRPSQRGYTGVEGHFAGGGGRFWKDGQTDRRGFAVTGYKGWVFQSEDGKTLHPELGLGLTPGIDARFAEAALRAMRRSGDRPWFCHVNFTGAHDPLLPTERALDRFREADLATPPDFMPEHPFDHGNFDGRDERLLPRPRTETAVRELRRDYLAVVEDLDRAVGRILDGLAAAGEAERTYVVFTSDHGLAAGSHGLSGKQNQYEHTLRVPLLVAGPGIEAGRSEAMVELRDLFPTSCELAGIAVPASVTARSFAGVLRGERETHREAVHGIFTDTQRSLRTADGWKLIHYPQIDRWQLFDLKADPRELRDLAGDPDGSVLTKLQSQLHAWREKAGDPALTEQSK